MLSRFNFGTLIMWITIGVLSMLIMYPIGVLIYNSFTISEWPKPIIHTLDNYREFIKTDRYVIALKNSLIISCGSTALAGLLGVTLAWITARTNTPLRGKLEPLNMIPYFLSPLVGAICWMFIVSPRIGILNVFIMKLFNLEHGFFNIYSTTGIIWVMGLFWAPYVYLFVIGSFEKMDPALEEASRTSGATILQTMWNVTLPLALPSILFSLVIIFVVAMGLFSVPAILGLPYGITTLGTEIWELVNRYPGDYNMAAAVSMITLCLCIVLIFIQRKIILPRQFITVTGKGYRPSLIDLGKWKYVTLAFNLSYLFIAVIMPALVLVAVSFHKVWNGMFDIHNLTLNNYRFILTEFDVATRAIWNSLILGFVGATVCVAICMILAYIVVRMRMKGRGVIDFYTSLPVGIPHIVMAMGILLTYIKTPIYGTLWLMGLAYITVFMPIGMRNSTANFLAISPEMEESSRICGASWLSTMARISVPLMKSGLIGGWLILFLVFMKEVNTSILLFSAGSEVMAIVLFSLLEEYDMTIVASYACILMGILLVTIWVIRRVVGLEKIS